MAPNSNSRSTRSTRSTLRLLAGLAVASTLSSAYLCPAASTHHHEQTLQAARAVLDGNWVPDMNSTLPSPTLYPHQWSWDASFVAMGYSHYDTRRAVDETDALFRGQWKNGLLPHIVFNPSTDESYFPGPAFWRINTSPSAPDAASTSGIVQPPVHAVASLSIYNNARTPADRAIALAHLRDVYPKLALWHNYLYNHRDPLNEGLVYIRHMWESGMDNSPAWDAALQAIHLTPDMFPSYTRVDKGKVGHHKERPNSFFYDRAVYLIKIFYDNSYDEAAIFEKSPFLIQDVLFNSILARAGRDLADIADILELPEDARLHRERSDKTAKAITSKLYDPVEKFFFDYDMVAKQLIPKKISGGLVALLGAETDDTHVNAVIDHLYSDDFLGEDLSSWTIPSVSKNDPGYTNTTYWKGPAWLNINYLVGEGLLRTADTNPDARRIAAYLKDRSIEMVNTVGFYEYFNPISGSPHGGHQFSWSAALTIDWICNSKPAAPVADATASPPQNAKYLAYVTIVIGLVACLTASFLASARNEIKDEPFAEADEQDVKEVKEVAGKSQQRNEARLAVPRPSPTRLRVRNTRTPSFRRET